jgi:hypothetical protein
MLRVELLTSSQRRVSIRQCGRPECNLDLSFSCGDQRILLMRGVQVGYGVDRDSLLVRLVCLILRDAAGFLDKVC